MASWYWIDPCRSKDTPEWNLELWREMYNPITASGQCLKRLMDATVNPFHSWQGRRLWARWDLYKGSHSSEQAKPSWGKATRLLEAEITSDQLIRRLEEMWPKWCGKKTTQHFNSKGQYHHHNSTYYFLSISLWARHCTQGITYIIVLQNRTWVLALCQWNLASWYRNFV